MNHPTPLEQNHGALYYNDNVRAQTLGLVTWLESSLSEKVTEWVLPENNIPSSGLIISDTDILVPKKAKTTTAFQLCKKNAIIIFEVVDSALKKGWVSIFCKYFQKTYSYIYISLGKHMDTPMFHTCQTPWQFCLRYTICHSAMHLLLFWLVRVTNQQKTLSHWLLKI